MIQPTQLLSGSALRDLSIIRPAYSPITRESDGHFAFGGIGEPVDWVVEMQRFDESQTLDHLSDSNGISPDLAASLSDAIATVHQDAQIVNAVPWLDALPRYIHDTTAALRQWPVLFALKNVDYLESKLCATQNSLQPLLKSRGLRGLIRRGHGDLHLGNIVLLQHKPVLFDALEFDAVMASGDVLYDLSFLLMDLLVRRQCEAANIVLNRYFSRIRSVRDYDGLAALPFFMSLRAAI